jgi:hypothetical protein
MSDDTLDQFKAHEHFPRGVRIEDREGGGRIIHWSDGQATVLWPEKVAELREHGSVIDADTTIKWVGGRYFRVSPTAFEDRQREAASESRSSYSPNEWQRASASFTGKGNHSMCFVQVMFPGKVTANTDETDCVTFSPSQMDVLARGQTLTLDGWHYRFGYRDDHALHRKRVEARETVYGRPFRADERPPGPAVEWASAVHVDEESDAWPLTAEFGEGFEQCFGRKHYEPMRAGVGVTVNGWIYGMSRDGRVWRSRPDGWTPQPPAPPFTPEQEKRLRELIWEGAKAWSLFVASVEKAEPEQMRAIRDAFLNGGGK